MTRCPAPAPAEDEGEGEGTTSFGITPVRPCFKYSVGDYSQPTPSPSWSNFDWKPGSPAWIGARPAADGIAILE